MDEKIDFPQKETDRPIASKKDLKCVWMTAGLISYKLCKYDLQCERCPLDWELRNVFPVPPLDWTVPQGVGRMTPAETGPAAPRERGESGGEKFSKEELPPSNIKRSLFYHPGHTWVKVEKTDEVRIGLDDFLGRIVGKVKAIILPLPGSLGHRGENLCPIIQEEGILHVVFPVSGWVLSVNHKLKDQPQLITQDPFGEGFLLTMKPRSLRRDQRYFLSGDEALSWYRKEWERFKMALISEVHYGPEPYRNAPIRAKMLKASVISELWRKPGVTMQDGEINLRDIKKSIGPERYVQLISTFLRKGEEDYLQCKYKKRR
ncbi:MAG: glycine cleavage system protein H [Syntrophaceae bacterium]|nr:glycine cleavage system protein H [Syntrophaceae bacterium]